jgi:uncharacterized protein
MAQDLTILKEIQEWDKEIYSCREALEESPLELDQVKQDLEEAQAVLDERLKALQKLQLQQKEKEVELESKEENVKKYEGQLSQIKTNKEYTSLQTEIKSLKADNSLLEEAIIEFIDNVEALKREVEVEKKEVNAREEALNKKSKEVEDQSKVMKQKIEELNKLKEDKVKQVDPEIAARYEQIVRSKRGLALIQVQGEACPACQFQLRPQIINEIKLKESIVACENCSRILYE